MEQYQVKKMCADCKKPLPFYVLEENGGCGLCPFCYPDRKPQKIEPMKKIRMPINENGDTEEFEVLPPSQA